MLGQGHGYLITPLGHASVGFNNNNNVLSQYGTVF